MVDLKDNPNPLHLSWHDSAWIPHLNASNILDYFSERSNPFYDRTCNNEIVKMQKISMDQLINMPGLEYILLHVQEPILFVIRKQHRRSPENVTPLADYYIIAGYVYQAPDLNSFINSRLYNGIHHLLTAFDEAQGYMKYHPTKGYSWQFNKDGIKDKDLNNDKNKDKQKEEPSSTFQRARVDHLLGELYQKFFPKINQTLESAPKPAVTPKGMNGFNAEPNDTQRQNNSENKNLFKNDLTNGVKKFK